jgi:hypothetical protein
MATLDSVSDQRLRSKIKKIIFSSFPSSSCVKELETMNVMVTN